MKQKYMNICFFFPSKQQQVFQIQQLPLQSQAGQTQQVFLSGATTDTTVSIADQ